MKIIEKTVEVKDYVAKSNLPTSDFVINPYVGCPHACKYCYARFMKRFTGHKEEWGRFTDIKKCSKPIDTKKLTGKSVFLSSVTDCYNPLEKKYGSTRKILEQLAGVDCRIGISTKSSLILRDIDILKQLKNLTVSVSINTADEKFRSDMDDADSIEKRIDTLRQLYNNGIYTVLFMSPMFPGITDFKALIERTRNYVGEYWFENLNLRGDYKQTILSYIYAQYPELTELYKDIYLYGDKTYWKKLSKDIEDYCESENLKYKNYFYHSELVKDKLSSSNTRSKKKCLQ